MKKAAILFLGFFSLCSSFRTYALPKPEHVYWVILAGGGGTRLWPLSRADKPKQFLNLTDSSLIEQSVERLKSYPHFNETNVFVSTSRDQAAHVYENMDNGLEIKGTIEEPGRRDTGPAILLAVTTIMKQDPDANIMFLPSDPYIPKENYHAFSDTLKDVMEAVDTEDKLVLLGKKPEYPATGFGYIEYRQLGGESKLKSIARFHEKPNLERASHYLQQDNMLWNMGMFAGKAKVFDELFRKYAPRMYAGVKGYANGTLDYMDAEKKSVDFPIMEPASLDNQLLVLPVDSFSWQDVGNIDVYLGIKNNFLKSFGLPQNPIVSFKRHSNKALSHKSDKMIAFVGVEGLCVVDTDNALLIAKCNEAENVKQVVDRLSEQPKKYAPYL